MLKKKTILIVDDHKISRQHLKLFLGNEFNIVEAIDKKSCLKELSSKQFSLVLLDLLLPDVNQFELLEQIKKDWNKVPVIVLTSEEKVDLAVQAMQNGASDYITKREILTCKDRLKNSIKKHILISDLQKENHLLKEELKLGVPHYLIPKDTIYEHIYDSAVKVVKSGLSLLISGETGVGKDILAKHIHQSLMPEKPLVIIDCGTICTTLAESELFGHEQGAFTDAKNAKIGKLELADQGILFLDELGNMPLEIQAKFLRAIEDKKLFPIGAKKPVSTSFQLICATNKNLDLAIEKGEFRSDLYFRIAQYPLEMPPIRKYPDALKQWIDYYINFYSQKYAFNFAPKDTLMSYWLEYSWPGNLRELSSEIQKNIFQCCMGINTEQNIKKTSESETSFDLGVNEKSIISKALIQANFNVTRAGKLLNIPRTTLIGKIKKYDLTAQILYSQNVISNK